VCVVYCPLLRVCTLCCLLLATWLFTAP
jgi:hypothetical protein